MSFPLAAGIAFAVVVGYVVLVTAALATPKILREARRPGPTMDDLLAALARQGGRLEVSDRQRARILAAADRYVDMLAEGLLRPHCRDDDPGNGDAVAVLASDPHGVLTGIPDGRVLLVENPPTGHGTRTVHAIPVPPAVNDPIEAAAWTYDDDHHPVRVGPVDYLRLARRT